MQEHFLHTYIFKYLNKHKYIYIYHFRYEYLNLNESFKHVCLEL